MSSVSLPYTTNAKEVSCIAALLLEFRQSIAYVDRLAFWDRHWNELKEFGCECKAGVKACNCEVLPCYAAVDFDDDLDGGKARIGFGMRLWIKCKTWEDVLKWPIITLAPFSKSEAHQFVDWALDRRPGMNEAPGSFESLRQKFEEQYMLIPSDLDRAEFLKTEREKAYRWKNDEVAVGYAFRKNLGESIGIDMDLFAEFARNNKLSKPINLAKHIPIDQANIDWKVIDTYLFARSKYQYALFLEHFEPISAKNNSTSYEFKPLPVAIAAKARTVSEIEEVVNSIIAPLSGLGPFGEYIMSPDDFGRLIEYTNLLVTTDKVPDIKTPFSQLGISAEHIRYTFYRLHKELFGTRRIHSSFIEFLHLSFSQFADTQPTSTKKKFSTKPKSYDRDFQLA